MVKLHREEVQLQLQACGGGKVAAASTGGGASGGGAGSMLQFYTDDAPRLKISPVLQHLENVLVMSIGFIAFVAILHVMDSWASSTLLRANEKGT
ncbi:hypothetical protein N665_1417s0012 [Sinapis alba]|nr:hypothetical protein N665_1417s0012 [Sinapis alba]